MYCNCTNPEITEFISYYRVETFAVRNLPKKARLLLQRFNPADETETFGAFILRRKSEVSFVQHNSISESTYSSRTRTYSFQDAVDRP